MTDIHNTLPKKELELNTSDTIIKLWAEALKIEVEELDINKSFFELGGYSLLAVSLARRISEETGMECSATTILTNSRFSDFAGDFKRNITAGTSVQSIILEEKIDQSEAYILTDLQQAYWLGEQQHYELGGAGTWFCEYEAIELDVKRFSIALGQLADRHPALRTVFDENAFQRSLPLGTKIPLIFEDISSLGSSERATRIQDVRLLNRTSANCIGLNKPHLTSITILKSDKFHIFMTGRLIIVDGRSGEVFAEDLWQLYQKNNLEPLQLTVKDYITFLDQSRIENPTAKREHQEALTYWEKRIPNLNNAPDIPRKNCQENTVYPMKRFSYRLPKKQWRNLQKRASEKGQTPTTTICSTFAHLLSYWSGDSKFALNVMYGNRQPYHEDVNNIIGCLSHTLLLEVNLTQGSFAQNTRALQSQLYSDMVHWRVSGIEVLRKLAVYRQETTGLPLMPIVFASGLGLTSEEDKPFFMERFGWKAIDNGIQTPHVLLDHQIAENDGHLMVQWDVREDLLPEGVPQDMFDVYCGLLMSLASDDFELWDQELNLELPEHQKTTREAANITTGIEGPYRLLHEGFFKRANDNPEDIALHYDGEDWSYQELLDKVQYLLSKIKATNPPKGSNIGIMMEKGPAQVASTLAVLAAECVYIPISTEQPDTRIQQIVDKCKIENLLFQSSEQYVTTNICRHVIEVNDLKENIETLFTVDFLQDPDDLAYIIFTSGTTGVPKGVAISHRGALNTIVDINHRFEISHQDVILGVSELSFDLSVYDIFGTLTVGGTLVIPPSKWSKSPIYLTNIIAEKKVTVWNSVPAFLEMLVEYSEARQISHLQYLNTIMLSGDWVPLNLHRRIKALNNNFQFICMGGATEASIWSNFQIVDNIPDHWASIPYGRPLANQSYHVLDSLYRDAPDWVAGEIYIGGIGLAVEYYQDIEKTKASFIRHPITEDRLYKTGDWGRYWPDGTLEFLGRRDSQVKVRGHRIELGEVESGLSRLDGVKEAIAMVHSVGGSNSIFAFIIPNSDSVESKEVQQQLTNEIPSYMIPSRVIIVDQFPVTANQKIDRKTLLSIISRQTTHEITPLNIATPVQKIIISLWEDILGMQGVSVDSNFFSFGGDSISVIRMLNQLGDLTERNIDSTEFYLNSTVRKLSEIIDGKLISSAIRSDVLVPLAEGGDLAPLFCLHPVGGNVFCYRHLATKWNGDVFGLKARNIDEGSDSTRNISDMAQDYVEAITGSYPIGVVQLLGWSMGGLIAMEVSRLLQKQGRNVKMVMLDTWVKKEYIEPSSLQDACVLSDFFSDLSDGLTINENEFKEGSIEDNIQKGLCLTDLNKEIDMKTVLPLYRIFKNNVVAIQDFDAYTSHADTLMIRASNEDIHRFSRLLPINQNEEWMEAIPNSRVINVEEDHFSIVSDSSIEHLMTSVVDFFNKDFDNE